VFNDPTDVGVKRRLAHLPELWEKGRAINQRLLMIERAGQGCAIGSALFERIQLPYVREGQRTGALRFGDPRVMALVGALCVAINAVAAFTNRSLRAQVSGLLAAPYTATQMTYDLRRLRRKGLIRRLEESHSYVLTPDGIRVAAFYTKVYKRVLAPLMAANCPPAPFELSQALRVIERHVAGYIDRARLQPAA